MNEVKVYGKDTVIFASREDHAKPSTVAIPEPERPPGLILEDGSINWNCPCLGGMATGPCGLQFREAFTCFHYSTAETKGSDCVEQFTRMQECMKQYPTLYSGGDDDESEFGKQDVAPQVDKDSPGDGGDAGVNK